MFSLGQALAPRRCCLHVIAGSRTSLATRARALTSTRIRSSAMPASIEDGVQEISVVGICGSLRENSLTKQALTAALQGAKEARCTVELIDLNDYQLYFCDGLEYESKNAKKGSNDLQKLKHKVKNAQGLLLGTPEYHNSYSGVLKNAMDLMGFDEFEGKVIGLVAVSGGAMGGITAVTGLRDVCRALHAWVIPDQCTVPQAWKNLEEPDIQKRLKKVGRQVALYSHLHANARAKEFLSMIERGAENPGGFQEEKAFEEASAAAGGG